jgi:hypothetical protein
LRRLWYQGRANKASYGGRVFRSLIDLGTASVKVLIAEIRQGQVHIWGHGQAALEGGYGPAGEIVDPGAVTTACDVALSAAEEMTRHSCGHKIVPDQSVWSVPAWLCQGQAFAFQQQRPRPTKRISRREWHALQERLNRSAAHLPGTPVDVIPSTQVEGHTVTDAIGLQGEALALQAFVVSTEPDVLATLQKVAAALELDPPVFVSQARAAAAGLSFLDGVILDIGRWGTGIVVARLGQLAGSIWASLGGQSFYRPLVNGFGLAPSRLPDFCRAYAAGQLAPETAAAADAVLVDPVSRWLDLVAEQLATLATETSLPHRIYLAGGVSQLPAVLQGTRHYAWMRQLAWPRHPEVHLWQATALRGLMDHTHRAWDAADLVRLGLAQLALGRIDSDE